MKLEDVEGIGPSKATKLRKAGVRSTAALLTQGATAKGREAISQASGLASSSILEWVNRVDLMRIKGVSTQYSDLLEAAGVDSPAELARRNAANLVKAFEAANNGRRRLVQRVPSEKVVADWIAQAKKLPKLVKH